MIVVAAGIGGVGYVVGLSHSEWGAPGAPGSTGGTLSVLAAGTLSAEFPELASLLANEIPV